jgi:hypothetical protein
MDLYSHVKTGTIVVVLKPHVDPTAHVASGDTPTRPF